MWGVEICKIYSKIMKKYHHCVKFTYPLSFQTRIPKVDQHTGGKWLIKDSTKRSYYYTAILKLTGRGRLRCICLNTQSHHWPRWWLGVCSKPMLVCCYWALKMHVIHYKCLYFPYNPSRGRPPPLTRYVKLCVVHALGMPETFSPPPSSKQTAS